MSLQFRFFHIPGRYPEAAENKLNSFLRSHRVVTVHREFFGDSGNSFWTFAVEYFAGEPGKNSQ